MACAQQRLRTTHRTDRGLILEWDNGLRSAPIPWLWLRDHGPCAECRHPHTRQRLVNTFQLTAEPAFEGARHVAGCYLNREDFESRLRVLRSA